MSWLNIGISAENKNPRALIYEGPKIISFNIYPYTLSVIIQSLVKYNILIGVGYVVTLSFNFIFVLYIHRQHALYFFLQHRKIKNCSDIEIPYSYQYPNQHLHPPPHTPITNYHDKVSVVPQFLWNRTLFYFYQNNLNRFN